MYGLLVEKVSTQETAASSQKYKQEMFSPVLVNYVPDTETGGSIFEQVVEFYTILKAVDEAEAGKGRFWWQREPLYCCQPTVFTYCL